MSPAHATALLPPPTTDPAPLGDVEGGETNLLHRTAWSDPNNPLKVRFEPWENSAPTVEDPEQIQIFLGVAEIGRKEWTAPISPGDFFVPISADKLAPGEHSLTYVVTIWSGTPHGSEPFTITVDKEAPLLNSSSKLIFPPAILPPDQITAAYLADPAHEDQVLATLPDYTEKKVGDVITWYWEQSPGGRDIADTKTLKLDDLGKALQVSFKGDLLRRGNGEYYATYRVRDRAGNETVLSSDVKLNVNIRPPTPRKFPTVKQATSNPSGTGVLNPFLGTTGVTVVVAAAEVDPDEEVTVDFVGLGGESGIGSVTGVKPISPGGLEFSIPAPVVAANIPVSGDGRKVEVHYWTGHDAQHSAVYTLTINELAGESFGSVNCPEAQIGSPATLSKSKVALSGANVEIDKWAYHEGTHRINVWAIAAGTRTDFLKGAPTPINANGKFTTALPKDYVAPQPLNSTFTLYASVSFDQGHSYRAFKSMAMKLIT